MKRTINLVLMLIAALMTLALTSCESRLYDIRLKNGSIVSAKDEWRRDMPNGTRVCLVSTSYHPAEWNIQNDGILQDTVIIASDTTYPMVLIYQTGTVIK